MCACACACACVCVCVWGAQDPQTHTINNSVAGSCPLRVCRDVKASIFPSAGPPLVHEKLMACSLARPAFIMYDHSKKERPDTASKQLTTQKLQLRFPDITLSINSGGGKTKDAGSKFGIERLIDEYGKYLQQQFMLLLETYAEEMSRR